MAVKGLFSSRATRQWLPLVTAIFFSASALKLAADEPDQDSPSSTIQQRIASLFRTSYVQPEEDAEPEDPDLSALSELESLLSEPVLVPGEAPASLTDVISDQPRELPPGFVVAPVGRRTPAAVTRIDHDQIWMSGARSLNELFDIYVPNVQVNRHYFSFNHVSPRGLVSDLEDKYLLVVNGRVMNHRTFEGVFSERDLPMLGDIHHVDFIRGPGSAIYGPGAVAGVVNITTHNGLTFQGTDVTVTQGGVEQFSELEIRHGRKIDEESGLFVYYGMADYRGAAQADSPVVYGRSFDTPNGFPSYTAGQPSFFEVNRDHAGYRSHVKHKLHVQYTHGNFDFWVRYTEGGQKTERTSGTFSVPSQPANLNVEAVDPFQVGYQQLTVFAGYNLEWTDTLNTDLWFSYDTMDHNRLFDPENPIENHREDEYFGRILTRWTPNECHSFALGFDISREQFGLRSNDFKDLPAFTRLTGRVQGDDFTPWWTTAYSFLGEYRWQPNDCWTFFIGTRADKHTYTEWLNSPRAVAIYTPDEINTFKFIASQAVRRIPDDTLRGQFLLTGEFGDTETIQSLEGRWERQHTEPLWLAFGGFYQNLDFVGFRPDFAITGVEQAQIAEVGIWGLELEASYRTECTQVVASHGFTKLNSFALLDPTLLQGFSAKPYGFGDDLANWSPHVSKIALQHHHNCCWRSNASLVIYWDFPGDEDIEAFNLARGTPKADPGYKKSFRGNYYLNYGLEYRPNQCVAAQLHLFNILGWLDKDYNKRNFLFQGQDYRAEAAAIAATLRFSY